MSDYVNGLFLKESVFKDKDGVEFSKIRQSICLEDFLGVEKLPDGIDTSKCIVGKNGKHYLNTEILRKREVGQYGDTHYVKYDTWEPQKKKDLVLDSSNEGADSLPF